MKTKKISVYLSPAELFLKIQNRYEYVYLLESMSGTRKLAEFSFIGFNPRLVLTGKNGKISILNRRSGEEMDIESSDPLLIVKRILGDKTYQGKFRFCGGAVGYISYDAVRYWEKLPNLTSDDLQFPDVQMGVYDDGVVFDHMHRQTFYFFRGEDKSKELSCLMKEPRELGSISFTEPKVNISKDYYECMVRKAKDFVTSGDIFQVVLSKRHDFTVEGDLTRFYLALKKVNPSPYMYFLKMGERKIIGSSPEMLMRIDGLNIETFPIAGTRPRVEDPVENSALTRELLSDPKERSEHVMLVDLARNDLGRISRFGTIHVSEFMQVHQYSNVQHIVSRVTGELRDGIDCYDALKATFPAGTVSGAPKIRAMEIIEESEPSRRGPYAGAVGYFSYNGNADFAITIRTLVTEKDRCHIQAGGGIVADSIPENEWFETEYKARALMRALEISED